MANANITIQGVDLNSYFLNNGDYNLIDSKVNSGSLWGWGVNSVGELATNDVVSPKSSPIQTVSSGTDWKMINGSMRTPRAIKSDGTLWTWGINNYGVLGNQSGTVAFSSPVQTVSGGTNWKYVGTGYNGYAIKTDGSLWCWGKNTTGSLGTNVILHRTSPVQTIAGGNTWVQVSGSGSGYMAGAIKTDGTLWVWGLNGGGQLGDNATASQSSPVQTIAGGNNWKFVSAGGFACAALKTDGTLWMWGANTDGNLGTNDIVHRSSPVQTVAGGSNWSQVSCGTFTSAAIKTDGTLWSWGNNLAGQLGDNTSVYKSSPVQTISGGTNWKQIDMSDGITPNAIKTDGTLWVWGNNTNYRLGITTDGTNHRSSPIQTTAGGSNWKQVMCGHAIYFNDAYNMYPST